MREKKLPSAKPAPPLLFILFCTTISFCFGTVLGSYNSSESQCPLYEDYHTELFWDLVIGNPENTELDFSFPACSPFT